MVQIGLQWSDFDHFGTYHGVLEYFLKKILVRVVWVVWLVWVVMVVRVVWEV